MLTRRQRGAAREGVPGEARLAGAHGAVVDDAAVGLRPARAGARVGAALRLAGAVARALGREQALGAAGGRPAQEPAEARARGAAAALAQQHAAGRVRAARAGRAGVARGHVGAGCAVKKEESRAERVSSTG